MTVITDMNSDKAIFKLSNLSCLQHLNCSINDRIIYLIRNIKASGKVFNVV